MQAPVWVFCVWLSHRVITLKAKFFAYTMGPTTLSKYVKIFDLTMLVETFFNKPMYTEDQLDTVEVFIKGYIFDVFKCVDHQEKEGMKLIKIHLLIVVP